MLSILRFNMVDPDGTGERWADRYSAMIEMAEFADQNGIFGVTLEEHHGTTNGWSPTPLLNAGMIAARTTNLSITISALLLPLHDPIRVAEDLAVLDLASRGRVITVIGLGYRPAEYSLVGHDWDARGARMDHTLETLMNAWSGEPFEYNGEMVQVTPTPLTSPHPMVMVGGTSKPAARRAARFGLPLFPAAHLPELEAYYYAKCEEYGTSGFCMMPSPKTSMTFISEDPDATWNEFGHHFLHEAQMYRSWQQHGQVSAVKSGATTVAELRDEGIYRVLTPAECSALIAEPGTESSLVMHPLVGGMPIEAGWESLKLFVEQVLSPPAS